MEGGNSCQQGAVQRILEREEGQAEAHPAKQSGTQEAALLRRETTSRKNTGRAGYLYVCVYVLHMRVGGWAGKT